jgi:hypothetical protein
MIQRIIQSSIEEKLFKGKAIILYGARQVGKTTILKLIAEKYPQNTKYFNCDEPDIRSILTNPTSSKLKELIGSKSLVLIDEAQRVKNIGITLKLIVDQLPGCQVIATGSSALGIADELKEPLTGRKYEFQIFPFSYQELINSFDSLEVNRLIEDRIIFGMYPEIVLVKDDRKQLLHTLASSYLYKDILSLQDIRKPEVLEKLLMALAFQIGNQVSIFELSRTLQIDKETVERYIDLLEKSFVIFRLMPFSRNLRSELSRTRKVYFYDTGIRNAIISNFQSIDFRTDSGALWENFLISERIKFNMNNSRYPKLYFWRTQQQQEIDLIEDDEGIISAFEMKWKSTSKVKIPRTFISAYPNSNSCIIDKECYMEFLTKII